MGHSDASSLHWEATAGRKPGLLWEMKTALKETEEQHSPQEQVSAPPHRLPGWEPRGWVLPAERAGLPDVKRSGSQSGQWPGMELSAPCT